MVQPDREEYGRTVHVLSLTQQLAEDQSLCSQCHWPIVFGAHTVVTVTVLRDSFVFCGLYSCYDKKTLHIVLTEHVTLQMARPHSSVASTPFGLPMNTMYLAAQWSGNSHV